MRSSAVASGLRAFLSAVRSAERWARLRTAAARDFRMFFLADAIFGTKSSPEMDVIRGGWSHDREPKKLGDIASYVKPTML